MVSAPSKQHIDLIRHRELNALRMLMAQRNGAPLLSRTEITSFGGGQQPPIVQTIERIDALEAQMTTLPTIDSTASVDSVSPTLQPLQPKAEQTDIHLAAAYFANQQTAQAQHHLEQAILPHGACSDHVSTWLTLLDLYRATGQPALFEAVALDFSTRFGRSTPSWISIVGLAAQKQASELSSLKVSQQVVWAAPAQLNGLAIEAFTALMTKQAAQGKNLILDWRALDVIEAATWPAVQQMLKALAQTKLQCQVQGAERFAEFLNMDTAASALTKLAWLRCQNLAEAFEDAALEYCEAFEVSPPDWQAPICILSMSDDLLFLNMATSASNKERPNATLGDLALIGEVVDQLPSAFARYSTMQLTPLKDVRVSCERLVRCDPQATLALRLWASTLHAQGTTITLTQAHRLVAAYFLSEGIYAFAKVTLRKD